MVRRAPKRVRQCLRKARYFTREDAEAGARLLLNAIADGKLKDTRPEKKIHAYHCNWCGDFHIGHQLKR